MGIVTCRKRIIFVLRRASRLEQASGCISTQTTACGLYSSFKRKEKRVRCYFSIKLEIRD
jgi:hypothetical protein